MHSLIRLPTLELMIMRLSTDGTIILNRTTEYVDAYSNRKPIEKVSQAMLHMLFATVSDTAIATMQDILDLGESQDRICHLLSVETGNGV